MAYRVSTFIQTDVRFISEIRLYFFKPILAPLYCQNHAISYLF